MTESIAIIEPMEATKTMKDAFNEMCAWRLEHQGRNHITEEYLEVLERESEITEGLKAILPKDKMKLLLDLEEVRTRMNVLDGDRIYKLGLKDGKELLNLF